MSEGDRFALRSIVIDRTSRNSATPLKLLVGSEPDQRVALELANATVDIESKGAALTLNVTAPSSIATSSGAEIHAAANTTIRQHAGDVPLITTAGDVMLVLSRNVNVSELNMADPGQVTVAADSSASSAQAMTIAKVTGSAAGTFAAGATRALSSGRSSPAQHSAAKIQDSSSSAKRLSKASTLRTLTSMGAAHRSLTQPAPSQRATSPTRSSRAAKALVYS